MTRLIVQVSLTFLVDAEKAGEAGALVLDSIKVEPVPGVQPTGKRLAVSDPFEDHVVPLGI